MYCRGENINWCDMVAISHILKIQSSSHNFYALENWYGLTQGIRTRNLKFTKYNVHFKLHFGTFNNWYKNSERWTNKAKIKQIIMVDLRLTRFENPCESRIECCIANIYIIFVILLILFWFINTYLLHWPNFIENL